jgi:hypothetical protein
MRKVTLAVGLGAAMALGAACSVDGGGAAPTASDPAVAFENLEVAADFTFANRRGVKLRLEASVPGVAQHVEVTDSEGRRLFAGGVRGDLDLDLDVPNGAEPVLNVRVGRGEAAVTRTVDLVDGRGSASF